MRHELRQKVKQRADAWRYRCRGLPLLVRFIEVIEACANWIIDLYFEIRTEAAPSRYERLMGEDVFIDRGVSDAIHTRRT